MTKKPLEVRRTEEGFARPIWVKPFLRRTGFTLGEIITTVAVIGTITAIAAPQYLRIKMNANMEMVRQQMKVVAEKMTEIMTNKGKYPDVATWPDKMNPGDPDEASLMGNLSAIDGLCYTNTDIVMNDERTTYKFKVIPKTAEPCGKWAGNKGFAIPGSSTEVAVKALAFYGEVVEIQTGNPWENAFKITTRSLTPSFDASFESNSIKLLNFLSQAAYLLDMSDFSYWMDLPSSVRARNPSCPLPRNSGLFFPVKDLAIFNQTLSQVFPELQSNGITLGTGSIMGSLDSDGFWADHPDFYYGEDYAGAQLIELGFHFTNDSARVRSQEQYDQKMNEFCSDPNGTIYNPTACGR